MYNMFNKYKILVILQNTKAFNLVINQHLKKILLKIQEILIINFKTIVIHNKMIIHLILNK